MLFIIHVHGRAKAQPGIHPIITFGYHVCIYVVSIDGWTTEQMTGLT